MKSKMPVPCVSRNLFLHCFPPVPHKMAPSTAMVCLKSCPTALAFYARPCAATCPAQTIFMFRPHRSGVSHCARVTLFQGRFARPKKANATLPCLRLPKSALNPRNTPRTSFFSITSPPFIPTASWLWKMAKKIFPTALSTLWRPLAVASAA